MEVTDRNTVFRGAAERAEVYGLDVNRGAEGFEVFLGLLVKGWLFAAGEFDASFSEVVLEAQFRRA